MYYQLLTLLTRQFDEVGGGVLLHLARALKEGALFDLQNRSRKIRIDPAASQKLDTLGGPNRTPQRSVDGKAAHLDLRGDFRTVAQNQLTARVDLALKASVDAEGLLESELAAEVAAPVDEAVQRSAVRSDFNVLPRSRSEEH